MICLDKNNILSYLKKNTFITIDDNTRVYCIGDDKSNLENDGDGYVNFIFRVTTDKSSYIVKQAREFLKALVKNYDNPDGAYIIPVDRNKLEYETMKLKRSIACRYVPEIYFIDEKNHIFIMEDVSYLKILRFQLNKMIMFENLSKYIGEYLALSNFYTSEFYLDTDTFRRLGAAFLNSGMRKVMEDIVFIPRHIENFNDEHGPKNENKELNDMCSDVRENNEIITEGYKMRDIFMKKGECLIHGDFHTSNIFISSDRMKVIDMEYTFMGPFSYDMGYLIGNFISQYCAASFRVEYAGHHREPFKKYILNTICEIYKYYIVFFSRYWNRDGKNIYMGSDQYREYIYRNFLHEMIGFACCANISRISGMGRFPDFDSLKNPDFEIHGKRMSLLICRYLLLNREKYNRIEDVAHVIEKIGMLYLKKSGIEI